MKQIEVIKTLNVKCTFSFLQKGKKMTKFCENEFLCIARDIEQVNIDECKPLF